VPMASTLPDLPADDLPLIVGSTCQQSPIS
jgi:hypothetical protein